MMRVKNLLLLLLLSLVVIVSSCKKEESISVSTDMLEVDYQGDDIMITVQSTSDWKVVANYKGLSAEERRSFQQPVWYEPIAGPYPDSNWIHPEIQGGRGGTTEFTVHIEPSTGKSRMAWLVFRLTPDEQIIVVPVYQQGKLDRDMSDKLSPGMLQYLGTQHPSFGSILDIRNIYIEDNPSDFSSDLVYFENLEELHCINSGLSAIDVQMPKLKVLQIEDSKVRRLNPDLFPALEFLNCSGNPLESLEILKAPNLQMATCGRVPVKELSLGSQLKCVDIPECGMERLDLSKASNLEELDCSKNNLKEVDLSATQVYRLNCSNNPQLSTLVLSGDILTVLMASSCNFTGTFSISAKDLFFLDLRNNDLEKLVITERVNNCTIKCDNNHLTEIVLPSVSEAGILGLTCTNNLLQGIGVIDPNAFTWEGSDVTQNPGKDNIFTIYVTKEPQNYWSDYPPQEWQWQGQTVSLRFVTRGNY